MSGDYYMYANQEVPESLVERLRCQKGNGNDKVDLSLCNITRVPIDSIRVHFGNQPRFLDLSYNVIKYISPRFTVELGQIHKLDLSRNEIRRLPDNFGDLKELVYLDLHKNKLQTLPLSMGKMERLQYLRLSENPFRAALKEFLGSQGRDVSAVALADLVVTFLKEMSSAHIDKVLVSESCPFTRMNTRNSNVHYRKRSSKCAIVEEVSSSPSEDEIVEESNDANANKPDLDRSSAPSSTKKVQRESLVSWGDVGRGLGIMLLALTLWNILFPILVAHFIHTSYLEYWAKSCPFWNNIWTNYYKPVHNLALNVAGYIPNHGWMIRPPHVELAQPGVFERALIFLGLLDY